MNTSHPLAPTTDDLIGQEQIKEGVRDFYRALVTDPNKMEFIRSVRERYRAAAGGKTGAARLLYDDDELAQVPRGAIEAALGANTPVRYAALRPGESVLDVGCGLGIDTFLAARAVAPGGKAIGLDVLPEMLERAAANAGEVGITNVEWLRGEMEAIPLPDASVDVVITNGVPNLSPRKARVFREMYRVLRPGGRIALADLVLDWELPPELATSPEAWAG